MAGPEADPEAEWLNLTRAAQRLGWPRERLRSLVRRGQLETRRSNTSELMVRLTPRLLAQAREAGPEAEGRPAHRLPDGGPEADPEAKDRLAHLEASLADAKAQMVGLKVALAKAEAERDATRAVALADVEAAKRVAETEIAATEAASQAKEAALRELVAELKAQLAEARRPWWRRLLG